MRSARVLTLVHPALLALAWTLSTYLATGTPIWALWRPAAASIAIALLVQLAISLPIRNRPAAALLASIVVLSLSATWTIALPLAVVVAWWMGVNGARAVSSRPALSVRFLEQVSGGLGFVAVVLVLLLGWQTAQTADSAPARPEVHLPSPGLTNIYVVLLDGYPRADVLATRFGIDIGPFVGELEQRGFTVHGQSRSNYTSTWATLASMFQGAYLEEIPSLVGVPASGPEQYRVLGRLVNDAPVVRELQLRGYRLVVSPPPYSEVALHQADEFLETIGPSWFEEQLLEKSVAATLLHQALPDLSASQQRDRIEGGLGRLAEAGRHEPAPIFFFDHILTPHPPFVFEASGAGRQLQDCFPERCSLWAPNLVRLEMTRDEYAEGLAALLAYLNSRLVDSIDALLHDDPDAVIVLFGDHATRYDVHGDAPEATLNFLATRTPNATALDDDISLINLFPELLNRYLGTSLPQHPFKAWLSTGSDPLPLQPLP